MFNLFNQCPTVNCRAAREKRTEKSHVRLQNRKRKKAPPLAVTSSVWLVILRLLIKLPRMTVFLPWGYFGS